MNILNFTQIINLICNSPMYSYYLSYTTNYEKHYDIVFLSKNFLLYDNYVVLKKYSLCDENMESYSHIPHLSCETRNDLTIPRCWINKIFLKKYDGEYLYENLS